ncbi:hypothetical protein CARUB_v10018375mg [Capsella rubella]|uniref:LOB domain-containing protein n=1 Tax=Capsella rubella TaxID=81985 RepID=R0FR77_9BRAS|nr:hypothetical protein CARUB_v10018375mg [Capsella rubella]
MEYSCTCKEVRHNCIEECVFAPYLPATNKDKYTKLSKVYDMRRLAQYVMDIEPSERQICVDSFCFEAEARLRDPVFGVTGYIHLLQLQLEEVKRLIQIAKRDHMMILQLQRNRQNHRHDHL